MPKRSPAATSTIAIDRRTATGTTAARAVRHAEAIPGVVYGHGEPTPVSIPVKALDELLTHGGKSHVIDVTVDGRPDSLLLRAVQRHPVTHRPVHLDFQRVSKTESITATIPVVTSGTSPAIRDGAIVDMVTRTIEVKGPAGSIPENVTVDISELPMHSHVTAGQLALPSGFALITSPEQIVISIEIPRVASTTAESPEGEAAAAAPAAAETPAES